MQLNYGSRRRRRKRGTALYLALGLQALSLALRGLAVVLIVCGCLFVKEHLFSAKPGGSSEDSSVGNAVPSGGGSAISASDSGNSSQASPDSSSLSAPPASIIPFGTPLAESERVEDSWFADAVFLGDSRTEGLQLFSGLKEGDFFSNVGMSAFRADSEKYRLFHIGNQSVTLLGTLTGKPYEAVYLMLGINDLGYPVSSYEKAMSELVDRTLQLAPQAVIYLQTLPPVNDAVAARSGQSSYITAAQTERFNEVLFRVAGEKHVVLLDVASVYRGADGQLPADLTSDGVHFTADGYKLWADYLRTHTVSPAVYFYSRDQAEGSPDSGTGSAAAPGTTETVS